MLLALISNIGTAAGVVVPLTGASGASKRIKEEQDRIDEIRAAREDEQYVLLTIAEIMVKYYTN